MDICSGWLAESGLDDGPWTRNNAPELVRLENVTHTYYNTSTIFVNNTNVTTTTVTNTTTLEYVHHSQTIGMPSSFSRFYQIQNVPIIKQSFSTLFPVMLLVLVPLFLSNLFNRLFVCLRMEYLQFGTRKLLPFTPSSPTQLLLFLLVHLLVSAIPTDEQLKEGKKQLEKYKKLAVISYCQVFFLICLLCYCLLVWLCVFN